MAISLTMPALSPTMETGTLAKWLVNEGDVVESGTVLAEIETDKATMELESIDDGTVGKLFVAVFAMFFVETYTIADRDLIIVPLMGIMCVAIPFVLVTIAPRFIPAAEVNLFFLLETIIGPFWVWMIIKEQPSIETILGGAVIIITIAIHSFLKLKNS